MAFFKEVKQDTKAGPTGEGSLSIIAAGMTVTGDIDSTGVVKDASRARFAAPARCSSVGRASSVATSRRARR